MFKSGKKLKNRKAKAFKGALNLIQNFKKMEEANALCIIKEKREVHLINEIFWQGKAENWKINFLKNLLF